MSDVLLAKKWENEDPTGWWMSEKLDGVRAVWRNGEFGSRGDNTFACPEWFKKKMPKGCVLDGEIWGGRGQFQKTSGIVRSSGRHNEWEFLTYMVFDCLEEGGASIEHNPFEARMDAVRRICASSTAKDPALKPVPMEKCTNRAHLDSSLAEIEKRGGEGLMLRSPGSKYEHRRSKSLLKVKTFYDEECIVVGHAGGTGRVAGMCGALLCETPDKRRFKVGSGLSDAQRRDPPPLNSVITYRYQELTQDNIPRFPTLVGERSDMTWAQICSSYVAPGPRKAGAMKRTHTILFDQLEPSAQASAASGASGSASGSRPALKRGLTAMDAMQRGTAEEDLDDFGFDDMLPPVPPEKKARLTPAEVPALEERPVCPFGRRCYRKNPAHFLEFEHPWLDAENEAKDIGAVAVPSLAKTQETGPVPLTGARSPAPEPKSFVDVQAEAEAEALPERTWTKDPDMRMVAVRNLLSSMLEDAEMPEARKHLQQMLDFADSVPSVPSVPQGSPASVAPPGPPAPAVTVSGDSRERPRSLASALLSTTTSEALFEVPLLEALGSAPGPAAAGSASSAGAPERHKEDPQSKLAGELTTMGFPEEGIREALLHCSNADEAVDWLLARSA